MDKNLRLVYFPSTVYGSVNLYQFDCCSES